MWLWVRVIDMQGIADGAVARSAGQGLPHPVSDYTTAKLCLSAASELTTALLMRANGLTTSCQVGQQRPHFCMPAAARRPTRCTRGPGTDSHQHPGQPSLGARALPSPGFDEEACDRRKHGHQNASFMGCDLTCSTLFMHSEVRGWWASPRCLLPN